MDVWVGNGGEIENWGNGSLMMKMMMNDGISSRGPTLDAPLEGEEGPRGLVPGWVPVPEQ
jgi:hypothetical protein